jgi:FkbH-like protein
MKANREGEGSGAESYAAVFAAVARMETAAASFADEISFLFLRNITIEGIDVLLKYHLFNAGIRARIEIGGYGTMTQDVLSPDGPLARTDPDVIVIAVDPYEADASCGSPGWTAERLRTDLEALFELLATRTRATIAIHTFIAPTYPELGLIVDPHGADLSSQIASLNAFVTEFVRHRAPRFCLLDWNHYARMLGDDAAMDQRGRYLWGAPFRRPFLDAYARQLSRVACALKGRAKKCLVLDCDNTLWGGVVGEDGIDGIQLDELQYPGKVYSAFQASVVNLFERGVLIALCSKNNEADVFEVLDRHAGSRLKRSHLVAWRINWKDKVSNLMELAEELNLGLDSFVFVDDNPVECGLIRELLPEVSVLEVPAKLHELPQLVFRDGLFDTLRLTDEDRQRARLYQGETQRKSVRAAFADIDEYLRSLETVALIQRVRDQDISRVAQLTQKTNQFNLTTRRYAEQEIRSFAERADCAVYSLTARDRFGTLGLVGVMIVMLAERIGRVDTLLLSCRALGRRLEEQMVVHCLNELAASHSVQHWEAEYIATKRNGQVADFWPRLGFSPIASSEGRTLYRRSALAVFESPPASCGVVERGVSECTQKA